MGKVTILTGHFGSGKTEIAINYALRLKAERGEGREVALVDLDLVNPFFRSREARKVLEEGGVRMVIPPVEVLQTDLPVIPAGVFTALEGAKTGDWQVVIDLGGDDQGVLALGQLRPQLNDVEWDLWLVVNPYRPFNQDLPGIADTVSRIEAAGRIGITGLISNPHLAGKTTREVVARGHALVKEAAGRLGRPIRYLAVLAELAGTTGLDGIEEADAILPIKSYLRPEWLDLN